MDAAEFEEYHLHDVRHSTASASASASASALVNQAVDLYVVDGILGHKGIRSTKRYAHLNNGTQKAIMQIR
jgi:site-specific recombinase XerD